MYLLLAQRTLLKITEDWKRSPDNNKYVAAILMDLSKAFDCLPHDLLLMKLGCYGVSDQAPDLLTNYFTNRKQCVKLGSNLSSFKDIYKGVSQGSILDPVFFNTFINECLILYITVIFIIMQMTTLYHAVIQILTVLLNI